MTVARNAVSNGRGLAGTEKPAALQYESAQPTAPRRGQVLNHERFPVIWQAEAAQTRSAAGGDMARGCRVCPDGHGPVLGWIGGAKPLGMNSFVPLGVGETGGSICRGPVGVGAVRPLGRSQTGVSPPLFLSGRCRASTGGIGPGDGSAPVARPLPLRLPPAFGSAEAHQASEAAWLRLDRRGEIGPSFCQGWVKVAASRKGPVKVVALCKDWVKVADRLPRQIGEHARFSTLVHDVKQRGDYTTTDASR
jgi:hypothetical protein